MYSSVKSLYFHWLFAILVCSDWLTVNQKKLFEQCALQSKLPSATFFIPPSWKLNLLLWFTFQVSKWTFIYPTCDACDSDIVEAKLKIPQESKNNRIPKTKKKLQAVECTRYLFKQPLFRCSSFNDFCEFIFVMKHSWIISNRSQYIFSYQATRWANLMWN